MGITLLSLQECMAKWLPSAISYMFISLYADDGVEYSSGMHFGWNIAISLTVPIMITTGGGSLGLWALFLCNMTIQTLQMIAVIGIEKLWHYVMGTSSNNVAMPPNTTPPLPSGKLPNQPESNPRTNVL